MDRLDVMHIFLRVAETGSFSKAARAAGVGQPAVSKQIAALEARLGAQLLRRTSRGVGLTEAGQAYYEAAVRFLGDLDAAEASIGEGQTAPSGLLRVTMTAGMGRMYVVPRLPEFFARYPKITLDIDISQRHVNLVEEGIDVAIRIGALTDSSLLAKRIGSAQTITVASPAYLAAHGEPTAPDELDSHQAVAFMSRDAPRPWAFLTPEGPVTLTPRGFLRANDAEYIRSAVRAGLGIAHNAGWLFAPDIASGYVKQILKGYEPAPMPIHAVWAGDRLLPGKARVFIDFLAQVCAEQQTLRIG